MGITGALHIRPFRSPLPLLIPIILLLSTAAHARTYHVSPSGDDDAPGSAGQPWATIGAAARRLQPGDTVLIHTGAYREYVRILRRSGTAGAPITYRAADDALVIVDASGRPHGIKVGASNVVLDGLQVTGARGFGIAVRGGRRHVTVRNCRVHGNGRSGIRVFGSDDVRIERCLVHGNGRHGIEAIGVGALAVRATTIWGHRADGIQASFSAVDVDDCIVAANGGRGIDAGGGATVSADHSLVWGNRRGAFARRPGIRLGPTVIEQDPRLRDPGAGDFRLHETSPARGAASDGGDMGYPYARPAAAGNRPPLVEAGPTQTVWPPDAAAQLDGTVVDDGLPDPPGRVTTHWTQVAGPTAVVFDDAAAVDTRAVLPAPGAYLLRLTADDGERQVADDVAIDVAAAAPREGFVAGSAAGWDLAAPDVLLQTIYGTRQDAAGTIRANTPVALSLAKGLGLVFDVPRDTALDTLRLKLHNAKPEVGLRLRLYDVTYRGLLDGSAPPPARDEPGGPRNVTIFDRTYVTPPSVPYHLEPLTSPSARYSELIVDLGPLEVLSGEYFLVIDNLGPSNTLGSLMVGDVSEAVAMGLDPAGRRLPGGVRVADDGTGATVRYYKLASTADRTYSVEPRSPALQLTTTIVNHPPAVDAGADQLLVLPDAVAHLEGAVGDDGHPQPPAAVTATWTVDGGPGSVRFADPSSPRTTASFSAFGVYVLRLTATDSALVGSDEVTIKWFAERPPNRAPAVDAGPDQAITLPRSAALAGAVSDEGEPDPPGRVTATWTRVSGPGAVVFDDPHAPRTNATFSADGTYVLRLTADDGQDSAADELTVVVHPFGRYEGYGAGATGGAGGRVVTVTTLRDGGAGSFRAAVDGLDGTPTVIQFAVGGEIVVGGEIRIARGNVTVMGSSAPAPGITLNGAFADRVLGIKASNVIVEHLRIRNAGLENIVLWGGRDIVVDHCSVTWSGDGALDINGAGYETGVNHVTISRSLFAGAVEVSRSRGHRISWHYNLFTHNNRRQPKIFVAGPDYNFVCNYVRAWGNTGINIQSSAQVNVINNFFGPPYPAEQWEDACYTSGDTDPADVYAAGNAHAADAPGQDARRGYDVNAAGTAPARFEIEPPPVAVTVIPAADVPANVIADVGALPRDAHDEAFIHTYGGRGREVGGDPP